MLPPAEGHHFRTARLQTLCNGAFVLHIFHWTLFEYVVRCTFQVVKQRLQRFLQKIVVRTLGLFLGKRGRHQAAQVVEVLDVGRQSILVVRFSRQNYLNIVMNQLEHQLLVFLWEHRVTGFIVGKRFDRKHCSFYRLAKPAGHVRPVSWKRRSDF